MPDEVCGKRLWEAFLILWCCICSVSNLVYLLWQNVKNSSYSLPVQPQTFAFINFTNYKHHPFKIEQNECHNVALWQKLCCKRSLATHDVKNHTHKKKTRQEIAVLWWERIVSRWNAEECYEWTIKGEEKTFKFEYGCDDWEVSVCEESRLRGKVTKLDMVCVFSS